MLLSHRGFPIDVTRAQAEWIYAHVVDNQIYNTTQERVKANRRQEVGSQITCPRCNTEHRKRTSNHVYCNDRCSKLAYIALDHMRHQYIKEALEKQGITMRHQITPAIFISAPDHMTNEQINAHYDEILEGKRECFVILNPVSAKPVTTVFLYEEKAYEVADKLARDNPDQIFFVLKTIGFSRVLRPVERVTF